MKPGLWHGITAAVAAVTVVVQFILVLQGSAVLDETNPPSLGARVLQFFSYFTIVSNLLVAVTSAQLARDPHRDGPAWRAIRLSAIIAIAVTGVVHALLLRPLQSLDGLDWWVDLGLHAIVPALAVIGWIWLGPRPRVDSRTVWLALLWPVAWLVYTLVMGQIRSWYPYPFIDVDELGMGMVLLNSAGVTVLFLALAAGARYIDGRLGAAPSR